MSHATKPRVIVAVTERVVCPNPDCEAPLSVGEYHQVGEMTEHPERATVQRRMRTHCDKCGRRFAAVLYLCNGQWLIEELRETTRSIA